MSTTSSRYLEYCRVILYLCISTILRIATTGSRPEYFPMNLNK